MWIICILCYLSGSCYPSLKIIDFYSSGQLNFSWIILNLWICALSIFCVVLFLFWPRSLGPAKDLRGIWMRIWGLSPLWLSPFQDFSPQIPCALTAQILTSPPYCDFWGASKCLIPQLSHNLSRKANKCGLCPKVLNSFQFLPAFRYSIAFNELFLNFVQNLFRHY